MQYPILTADEAAAFIRPNDTVGIGGFSSVGTPKSVPLALARRARQWHAEGKPFKVGLITGGATGSQIDSALAQADAVRFPNSNFRAIKTCARPSMKAAHVI